MTLYKREEHKTNVQYYGSSFKDNSTHKEILYSTWREELKHVNFQKNGWLGLQLVKDDRKENVLSTSVSMTRTTFIRNICVCVLKNGCRAIKTKDIVFR